MRIGITMTIKLHTFNIYKDNDKHLFFLTDEQVLNLDFEELAEVIYEHTGDHLEIRELVTHEFPNQEAFVNFLNGRTLHFSTEQKNKINNALGLDIWR